MANTQRGIELWERLATVINEEIESSEDKILKKNNYRLWNGYLHKWTNEDWIDILSAVADVNDQDPTIIRRDQHRALNKAAGVIAKEYKTNGRCLDTTEHKHPYWHMVMVLKEIWNTVTAPQAPKLFDIEYD